MSNLENLSLKELQDLHDEKREELNAVAKKTESFAAIVPWHIAPPRVITQEEAQEQSATHKKHEHLEKEVINIATEISKRKRSNQRNQL